jgi:hypothetical protein
MTKQNISSCTDLFIVFVLADIIINNNNITTIISKIFIISDSRINYQFDICLIFCNLHLIIKGYFFVAYEINLELLIGFPVFSNIYSNWYSFD